MAIAACGLVLATAGAGCGGDGQETASAEVTTPSGSTPTPEPGEPAPPAGTPRSGPGAAEQRAAAGPVIRQFEAIRAGDGEAACAEFSLAGERAFLAAFEELGEDLSCEEAVLQQQVPSLTVDRVTIDGDRATVVLEDDLEYTVERVDGEWKLSG